MSDRAMVVHDACYYRVKSQYSVWPSARASQALGKCRKKAGHVRKTAAGKRIRRWTQERWIDTRTGKACGSTGTHHEYCRPSRKVSAKTPVMARGKKLKSNQSRKAHGLRAKPVSHRTGKR